MGDLNPNPNNWKYLYHKCLLQHDEMMQRVQLCNTNITAQHAQINQSIQQLHLLITSQLHQISQTLQQLNTTMNGYHGQMMQNIQQMQQRANTSAPPIYACNIPIFCNPAPMPPPLEGQVPAPGPMRARHSYPSRHYQFDHNNIHHQNVEQYQFMDGAEANGMAPPNNFVDVPPRFSIPPIQLPLVLRAHTPQPESAHIEAHDMIEPAPVEQDVVEVQNVEVEVFELDNANVPSSCSYANNIPNRFNGPTGGPEDPSAGMC